MYWEKRFFRLYPIFNKNMNKTKKTVSLFFVALLISYYASSHFFYHTHKYAWGTVTHSHPYTSGTHSHSANVLQIINSLTTFLFVGEVTVFCMKQLPVSKDIFPAEETQCFMSLHISNNQLRAPPASV